MKPRGSAVVAVLIALAALVLPRPPAAVAACPGPLEITSIGFSPAQGRPGQTVTATVVAANCTDQPQSAAFLFVAQFVGATPGIPPGCAAIDPLPPRTVSFTPGGTVTAGQGYLIPASCTATALRVTARFTDATGAVIATGSADLPIAAPACAVGYRVTGQWPNGFTARVQIGDTGPAPITGWSLAFTYPGDQRIEAAWNATVHQQGNAVTASDVGSNATIAPGATVTFGILGRSRTGAGVPTGFLLNGVPCAPAPPSPPAPR
jgi:hypothetical protein